jgi:hypothetical protein
MPQAHKLRLGDGSVIELDRSDLRSWYERGLINDDTPVQPPGSSSWTRLAQVVDMHEWRGRRAGASTSRAAAPSRATAGTARYSSPSPWPRRLVLVGAVALVVAALVVSFELWWPAVVRLTGRGGPAAPSASHAEDEVQRRHRLAVQAAAAELPHLHPDTIELVMSSSAAGVLDPPEVFRRSYEAAGRGLAALDRAKSQELATLNSALSNALSARERVQLADYIERVRSRRPTSPLEDAEMGRLVRRGANSLSATRRARLQALLAEAIAAALGRPLVQVPGTAAGATTR